MKNKIKDYNVIMLLEGIILDNNPFEERACLIDLFSQEMGVVKIFSHTREAGFQPFSLVECVLHKGRKDLFYLKEAKCLGRLPKEANPTVLEVCLRLKESLKSIKAHDEILYRLFEAYLKHLHMALQPKNLLASFLLKLLFHEGLLASETVCADCDHPRALFFADGRWFCPRHSPIWALEFSIEELGNLRRLAYSRSLLEIDELETTERLLMKINQLFAQTTQ